MTLLTVRETAEILRVSEITVRRHIASGTLQAVRIGRSVRVTQDSLDRVLHPEEQSNLKYLPFTEDDPLFGIIGIGSSKPTDVSANKHKYLAEAYEDLHEE